MRIEGATVSFSNAELRRFAERWPCFGHRPDSLSLGFSDGALVDMEGDAGVDPGAILALADDAKRELISYGRRELRAALDRQRRATADSAYLIDESQAERGRVALAAAGCNVASLEGFISAELDRLDSMGVEL